MVKLIRSLDLEADGVTTKRYSALCDTNANRRAKRIYDAFEEGQNASNKLRRGIAWGVYARDSFTWLDRREYRLSKDLNPEEDGRTRIFGEIDPKLLEMPAFEELFRDIFFTWGFEQNSYERAYEIQLSGIRYEPTVAEPAMPSPVAPHQDLVDGAIVVINKEGPLVGGTSRIYDLDRNPLYELDLEVGEALFVRDASVMHQVTPILLQPDVRWRPGDRAFRDVLLVRFQPLGR